MNHKEHSVIKQNLVVGKLTAHPGEKIVAEQDITIQGKPYTLPMFLINGAHEGPTLAVTGGIHAAEYASIAAALDLGRKLEPETLHGAVVVVPIVNMMGYKARSIYINPMDGINLNRVFPGKADGSASEQIADWMYQNVMKPANYFIDLHGGDLVEALIPFTIYHHSGNEAVDKASLELARVFGIKYLVRSESVGSTFSAVHRNAGIPAILTESGGQGIWRAEDVKLHTDGLDRVLRHYGMLEGPKPAEVETVCLDQFIWLRGNHDGFWYPKVAVGDKVRKGQDVGCIMDYRGDVLQSVTAPENGDVLFLVSSLAINSGDPLLSIGA
jgi:uncharacterized protein